MCTTIIIVRIETEPNKYEKLPSLFCAAGILQQPILVSLNSRVGSIFKKGSYINPVSVFNI